MKTTRLSKTHLLQLIKEEVSKVKTKRRLTEATQPYLETLTFVLDVGTFEEEDRGGYGDDWITGGIEYVCRERPELTLIFGAYGNKFEGWDEIEDYPDAVRMEREVFDIKRRK